MLQTQMIFLNFSLIAGLLLITTHSKKIKEGDSKIQCNIYLFKDEIASLKIDHRLTIVNHRHLLFK